MLIPSLQDTTDYLGCVQVNFLAFLLCSLFRGTVLVKVT